MKPVIGHIVASYLPRSEIFTYRLINSLTAFDNHVFTTRTENLDIFPMRNLTVVKSESEYPGLAGKAGINLALSHFGPSGLLGMQVGLMNDIPSATIFHGYDVSMLLHSPRWVEQYQTLFQFGSHCICISEVGRQRLINIGCRPDRVSVVHLGVDVSDFSPSEQNHVGNTAREVRLLIVSRLAEKKGISYAMTALQRALERVPELKLRIVGDGEEREKLEALRHELGLEQHVLFLGAMDNAVLRNEMLGCHIYLQPSITAQDGDQEGIPVALMEALACGRPAIASRHSGIPELILDGRTGLLVEERDAEGLAAAIVRMVDNPDLARSIARAGRAWVEREFNLHTQATRFTRLLSDIMQNHEQSRARFRENGAQPGPKTLFLRSVPVHTALVKLMILKKRQPTARLTVLSLGSYGECFARCPIVNQVLSGPGDRFDWGNFDSVLRARIVEEHFDRIVVPYANDDGAGYNNVREFARAIGAREIVAMPWSQNEVPLADDERAIQPGKPELFAATIALQEDQRR
jgi:colanic acid/amylovoran biosynthesis glycosyltransferase